jgi:hypothetical protein
LVVTIGSVTATIAEGAGRRSLNLPLDASATGHLTLRLQSSGATTTTFLRPKLELGENTTPWIGDWLDVEETRCRRYYQRIAASGLAPMMMAALGQRKAASIIEIPYMLPVTMRAGPSIQTGSLSWSSGSPSGNQVGFYETASATWLVSTGSVSIGTAVSASASSLVLRFQAATSFSGAAGAVGQLYFGSSASIGIQAEL